MAFSPSADPWGAGMALGGALWCLAGLTVVARRLSRRSPDTAGGVMTLGATTFIVCGVLSVLRGEPEASAPVVSASVAPAPAPPSSPEPPLRVDDPPGATDGVPTLDPVAHDVPAPEEEPTPGVAEMEPDEPLEPDDEPDEPLEPDTPEFLDLPEGGAERRAAIRDVLRDARVVYDDEDACKDPEAVGRVWRAVAALPPETHNLRVKTVVKHLDACRRKIRWASTFVVHRDRLAAREAFGESLRLRLAEDHGLDVTVKTFGKQHERLRIAADDIDAASVEVIATDGLRAELGGMGFEQLVLARPGKAWREQLDVRTDADEVEAELAPFGLDDKLTLSGP